MNLKSLVHWELSQGLTEEQLASAVGVPMRTLTDILTDKDPQSRAIWEKFSTYFRMDVDFLQKGESTYARTRAELSGPPSHSPAGRIRNVPLLNWHQMGHLAERDLPGLIYAEAMVETTDVSGARTFALKVQDDSMEPLFSKGEMIFVNPDLEWNSGDYVIAIYHDKCTASTLLRQIKTIGNQRILHPLNRKYEDLPLARSHRVSGKVVRLRKNL